MKITGAVLGIALFFWQCASSLGQQPEVAAPASGSALAEISFQFEHVGLPVPRFTLRVRENGSGTYQADQSEIPATESAARGQAAQRIDRSVDLTAAMVTNIFKAARALNRFNVPCASKAKNIADTGKKTFTYSGPDGTGSCVYNYSENKTVQMLTDTFVAIAFTLDEGRKLEFLHRYDRLGLDAEMNFLAQEAQEGRALELGTISPTLAAIADDTAVIQRVRIRAARMVEESAENH